MYLKRIGLQNFRSYNKTEFNFHTGTTIIVGPNTSGKTNLIEAIFFLSTGKSFRAQKDVEAVQFGKEVGRVRGEAEDSSEEINLEVVISDTVKKFLVNGIARRRVDFAGNLVSVLFSPMDLDIIVGSPSLRRQFLDDVLEQADKAYRVALVTYWKALRQRNALLEKAQEQGRRDEKHFAYWDSILIEQGGLITHKREDFIRFLNDPPAGGEKEVFDFSMFYDKSVISKERLLQYKDAEISAGVTLVGPHRDDFSVHMFDERSTPDVKLFGSRGQQRLVILQLKLLQLAFLEERLGARPVLLLDDIFSELDNEHIHHVLELIGKQQTILTTTHKEFIDKNALRTMSVIELG